MAVQSPVVWKVRVVRVAVGFVVPERPLGVRFAGGYADPRISVSVREES